MLFSHITPSSNILKSARYTPVNLVIRLGGYRIGGLKLAQQFSTSSRLGQVNTSTVIELPIPNDFYHLLDCSSKRRNLCNLGTHSLKFYIYQKLSTLLPTKSGSILKVIVEDALNYVKKEFAHDLQTSDSIDEYTELIYFGSNISLNLHLFGQQKLKFKASPELTLEFEINKISLNPRGGHLHNFKWLLTAIGFLIVRDDEKLRIDALIDKIVDYYLKRNKEAIDKIPDTLEIQHIMHLMNDYYDTAPVNKELLYGNLAKLHLETINKTIDLPPLPQIKDKNLLTKALLHKDMSLALLHRNHPMSKSLTETKKMISNKSFYKAIQHSLSFLDGFGDLFIGKEINDWFYKVRTGSAEIDPYFKQNLSHFGLLYRVMVSNSLFSRLAVAYKLHLGLDDDLVRNQFDERLTLFSALAFNNSPNNSNVYGFYDSGVKFEQEILGDYFEQYVGALSIENPQLASEWINEVFLAILRLAPNRFNHSHYTYHDWCVDIIDRYICYQARPTEQEL